MQRCFAASEVLQNPRARSLWGEVAEVLIGADYCRAKGGCQRFDPGGRTTVGPQTDFFDALLGPSRCRHLGEYLALHYPQVDAVATSGQCEARKPDGGHFAVPDIISYVPEGWGEFYEIKPDSASGPPAGRAKLRWFEAIVQANGLRQRAGTAYSPSATLLLWDGTWFGSPLQVSLRWRLAAPGLLLYDLCVDSDLAIAAEALLKLLLEGLLAALLALLLAPAAAGGGAVAAGAAVLAAALPRAPSGLAEPFGPPDALGVDGRGGMLPARSYVMQLVRERSWRLGERPPYPGIPPWMFVPVVPGSDPPDRPWTPDAGGAWTWNAAALQAVAEFAPDGRFEPGGPAVRGLERDQLDGVLASTVAGAAAPLVGALGAGALADDEGDGEPLDPEALLAELAGDYLGDIAGEPSLWNPFQAAG